MAGPFGLSIIWVVIMSERIKYFRCQIISRDIVTLVYWGEIKNGNSFDVNPYDIPENAIVIDVTDDKRPKEYAKLKGKFVLV